MTFDHFTATQILREIKFWRIQTVKKCYFDNLATLNFEFLVNFELESCSNLLKSKFGVSKFAKNDIFGPFEFTQI